jgi:uncharacterized phage infection (PIP) family protein YhgE
MPSKAQLELLNDELLSENDQLRSKNSQRKTEFSEVAQQINGLQAQLKDVSKALSKPAPTMDSFAQQIAPLVERLGEVISTMERASIRADEKMQEMAACRSELEEISQQQNARLSKFSSLIEQAHYKTRELGEMARLNTESLLDMLVERGWRVLLMILISGSLAAIATSLAISRINEPNAVVQQQSDNWYILTYEMTPEQKVELMNGIRAKRQRLERETDSSAPSTTTDSQTPQPSPTAPPSATTPPGRRKPRR